MKDSSADDTDYDTVLRLLNARTGLTFREDQHDSTRKGIVRAMGRSGTVKVREFARLIEHDAQALDDLVVELTVGETYFFREPGQLNYIKNEILPEIRKRRGDDHTVRIWSAACASGEEPYSLAMLCELAGISRHVHILATDVSSEALEKARKASYREWSLRGEGAQSARGFLRMENGLYHVKEDIKRKVQFEFLNLALDMYPSYVTGTMGIDLILCRNVLIYFDLATIREVARRFFDSLAPGGWLITASGDPPLGDYADFEDVVATAGVFYRRPGNKIDATQKENNQQASWFERSRSEVFKAPQPGPTNEPGSTAAPLPQAEPDEVNDSIERATVALQQGDYARAAQLTEHLQGDTKASELHIKALANIDTLRAVKRCEEATHLHPVSAELHYLNAVLLMELNRDQDAMEAARRVVFLDRSLPIAHFTLASILQRRGSLEDALRHFRNARNLCRQCSPHEIVALSEGETAQQLAEAAEVHLTSIEKALN